MAALDDGAIDHRLTIAALRRELDERTAERDEALAQQLATSEILGLISRSPTDTQPVFEAIVARGGAVRGGVQRGGEARRRAAPPGRGPQHVVG
jgi:hypothetical protein